MSVEELKQKILTGRPELNGFLVQNHEKHDLAMELLKLRRLAGITKEALADVSGLSLDQVDRLEAPTGDLPSLDEIALFKKAC